MTVASASLLPLPIPEKASSCSPLSCAACRDCNAHYQNHTQSNREHIKQKKWFIPLYTKAIDMASLFALRLAAVRYIVCALSISVTACGGGGSTPEAGGVSAASGQPAAPVNVNVQVGVTPTGLDGSSPPATSDGNPASNQPQPSPSLPPDSNSPPTTSTDPVETPIAQARFNAPRGVAMNGRGDLFVADAGNYVVRKISRDGVVTTIAGIAGQRGTMNGIGRDARFSSLQAITVDRHDNVYVIDGHAIRMISPDRMVSLVAGAVDTSGYSDQARQYALFTSPAAIFANENDDVVVADTGNRAIRRISNGYVSTLKTTENAPVALVSAGSQIFYGDLFSVWVTDYQGNSHRIAGDYNDPYKRIDGVGYGARFMSISSITRAPSGNLYIGETFLPAKSTSNGTLRRMTPVFRMADWEVSTVGNTWSGTAHGATSDISGNIFLADAGNHVIRQITSDGSMSIYAGVPGERGANY